jgi:hypothetical protein
MKRTLLAISQQTIDIIESQEWREIIYILAFVKTTVRERRKFGPRDGLFHINSINQISQLHFCSVPHKLWIQLRIQKVLLKIHFGKLFDME